MEEKIFDLLAIMHNDIKDLKEGMKDLDNKVTNLDNKVTSLEKRVTKIEISMENDISKKQDLALEGYMHVYEKLQEHDMRFDRIESILENHDVEIRVIKGGK